MRSARKIETIWKSLVNLVLNLWFFNKYLLFFIVVHSASSDISLYSIRVVSMGACFARRASRCCQASDGYVLCWIQKSHSWPHAYLAQASIRVTVLRCLWAQRLLQNWWKPLWSAMELLHNSNSARAFSLQVVLSTRLHAHFERHNSWTFVLRLDRSDSGCHCSINGTFLHHSTDDSIARRREKFWLQRYAIDKSFIWTEKQTKQGAAASCTKIKCAWQSKILSDTFKVNFCTKACGRRKLG